MNGGRQMTLYKWVLISSLAIVLTAGCQAGGTNNGPDLKEEARKQAERAGQTLWIVIDEDGNTINNLPDDHPEVLAVREIVEAHAEIIDNRSPSGANAEDEYSFYTDAFIRQLQDQKYAQALRAMYAGSRIEIRKQSLAWYEMAFYQDMKTVRVKTESEFELAASSDDYLEKYGLILGQVYKQPRIVDLIKEGSEWKIAKIEKAPLEMKSSRSPQ